jgi:Flp pilus assembly protein TadG
MRGRPLRGRSGHPRPGAASRRTRGQAMAELALVTPILVLLVLSVVELGRAMAIHAAVVTGSREAARYGAAVGDNGAGTPRYVDCAGIRAAARNVVGSMVTLADTDIHIAYDNGAGVAKSQACAPHGAGPAATQIVRYDRVVVTVTHTYRLIAPVVSSVFGPITVVSTDRRTIVK